MDFLSRIKDLFGKKVRGSSDKEKTLSKNTSDNQCSDSEETLPYREIINRKIVRIKNGENEYFNAEFGSNRRRAIEIFNSIIEQELDGFIIDVLDNERLIAFINAFDTASGLDEFIKKPFFKQQELQHYNGKKDYGWCCDFSLETLYQLEAMIGYMNDKISPWVKLLRYGKFAKKIQKMGSFRDEKGTLVFPVEMRYLTERVGECIEKNPKAPLDLYGQRFRYLLYHSTNVKISDNFEFNDLCNFMKCANFENIQLNEDLPIIPDHTFRQCERLKQIILPSSVKKIGESAFSGCKMLKYVCFNEGLLDIEYCAFQGCKSLERVELPDSLEYIGANIFRGCTKLKEISISGKKRWRQLCITLGVSEKQINLVVRGLEIEKYCIELFLNVIEPQEIKSIEVMDGDVVAVRYDIDSKKQVIPETIESEIMQKVEEYKRQKGSGTALVKRLAEF